MSFVLLRDSSRVLSANVDITFTTLDTFVKTSPVISLNLYRLLIFSENPRFPLAIATAMKQVHLLADDGTIPSSIRSIILCSMIVKDNRVTGMQDPRVPENDAKIVTLHTGYHVHDHEATSIQLILKTLHAEECETLAALLSHCQTGIPIPDDDREILCNNGFMTAVEEFVPLPRQHIVLSCLHEAGNTIQIRDPVISRRNSSTSFRRII